MHPLAISEPKNANNNGVGEKPEEKMWNMEIVVE
jgi:hypothetical protein